MFFRDIVPWRTQRKLQYVILLYSTIHTVVFGNHGKTHTLFHFVLSTVYKALLRDGVDLKCWGRRKSKRGRHNKRSRDMYSYQLQ